MPGNQIPEPIMGDFFTDKLTLFAKFVIER